MDQRRDLEHLLRYDRSLRALARGLVTDASRADDVVQQTWVEALTNAPRAPVFAWLVAVAKRLAWRARREDLRRVRREHAAARDEATPSDAVIRAREALRLGVVEAVLALDEPYKTTVVLRFLEALPPRTVARRMGVPVETVRTRARRALELLRARLDQDHGGDRLAWSLPLARVAQDAALVPFLAGVLVVTTKTKLLAAGLLAAELSLGVFWLGSGPGPGGPFAGSGGAVAAPLVARGPESAGAPAREALGPAASQPASVPATTGSLLVTARWADGTPAADVGVAVLVTSGDVADEELVARSDAAGHALFAGLAPGLVYAFTDRGDHCRAEIVARQRTEVVLPRGLDTTGADRPRRVEGIVVDEHAAPVAGAEVRVGTGPSTGGLVAARTAADGTFVLRDVAVTAVLEARAPGYARSFLDRELLKRATSNDETPVVPVRLVLPGLAGTVRGTVRDAGGAPVAGALVQVGRDSSRAVIPLSPRPERVRTDRDGRFVCECAPLGSAPVCVRARGRGVWTGSVEVAAGREAEVAVELRPAVTIRGTVRDDAGQPVKGAGVRVGGGDDLAGTRARTRDDGGYELAGLAGGEIEIVATTSELGSTSASVTAQPGDALTQDLVLGAGITLKGRVVGEDGKPVVAAIQATISATAREPRWMTRSVATDAEGRFRLPSWREAPTTLLVKPKSFDGTGATLARVSGVLPSQGEVTITVRAADLPSAFLIGTLLGPDGKPCARARMIPHRVDAFEIGTDLPGLDAATGAFRLGPLASGTWTIVVDSHERGMLLVGPHRLEAGQTLDVGTVRMPEPGTLEVKATRADGKPVGGNAWVPSDDRGHVLEPVHVVNGVLRATLAPGRYRLTARDEGVADQRLEVEVRAGEATRLEVTLLPGTVVPITITAPREAKRVHLRIVDARERAVVDTTVLAWDDAGTFEARPSLAAGTYRAAAEADSGAKASFPITVEGAEAPSPLAIVLR